MILGADGEVMVLGFACCLDWCLPRIRRDSPCTYLHPRSENFSLHLRATKVNVIKYLMLNIFKQLNVTVHLYMSYLCSSSNLLADLRLKLDTMYEST